MKGLIFYILSMIIAFHAAGDNRIATKQQVKIISELQNQLKDMKQYTAEAVYEILLPSNDNSIKYHIEMQSVVANDTLSPCNYLISWRYKDNIDKPTEFTSYSNGKHYRFINGQLEQFDVIVDSIPFTEKGGCVQLNARFTNLLPALLANEIEKIANDSIYQYKITDNINYNGIEAVRLNAVETINNFIAREFTYIFNSKNSEPLYLEIRSNPETAAELLITVNYQTTTFPLDFDFSEEALIERYPNIFLPYLKN